MKTNRSNRLLSLLASSALLATSSLHAATVIWDANAGTALQTDGAGAWLTASQWWNGSSNVSWTSGDDAIFGNGGAAAAVGLASPTTANSLTFNRFTGTYTLGTVSQILTISNGITMNAGAGAVKLASPIKLGANQTWINNTGNTLSVVDSSNNSVIDTNTFNLTFKGNGPSRGNFNILRGNGITGSGNVTVDNAYLDLRTAGDQSVNNYMGTTTVLNGGSILHYTNNIGTGNITLNGGTLEGYFNEGFTRQLGTGSNQFQITGGVSGFGVNGNSTINFSNVTEVQWGSATFSPSKFVLGGGVNGGTNTFAEGIDLNGADRTVTTNVGGVLSAIVRTSTGTAGLIKEGPGTLSLTAANTYNGGTTIAAGTLTLSGSGTLANTTALNLSGGTLQLTNTAQVNRFADGAAITVSSGGGITYTNTAGANLNYTETLGSIALNGGLLNVNLATNQNNATNNSQTLTLGGLTPSGTGSVAFSAATTGPQASGGDNMIVVTGAGTTTAGQIVGPWATVGTTAALQTDYAVYNSDYVVPAAIAGSAETTWAVATDPYTMDFSSAATTLTATRNIGALRIIGGAPLTSVDITTETITLTGHTFVDGNTVVFGPGAPAGLTAGTTYFVVSAAVDTFKVAATNAGPAINLTSVGTAPTVVPSAATTLALSTGNNLGTNGILNGSLYPITIAPGTGGVVTLPTTSAGQLHVTTGSAAITISAPIANNTGALTLVKNGSAGTLILSAANNTYTGDTIINAGTLQVGVSGSNAQLNSGSYAGNIFIARGAALTLQGNSSNTLSGVISGDGNLNLNRGTTTLSGANTYTGVTSMTLVATNALGSTLNVSSFNSVVGGTASSSLGAPTTVANGTIGFGGGIQQSAQINYTGSGETTDRIINFQFNGNNVNRVINTSGSANSLLKFTSPFISNGTATNNVILQGSTNGEIVHGLPFAFTNFTKSGNGTWTLGGAVGNTGTTTVSAGTLVMNGVQATSANAFAVNGTSTLAGSGSIGSPVTVAAGANLSPGAAAVGTLTFRNNLTISALAGGAGKLDFGLGPIATSDKMAVSGTLAIGSNLLGFNNFNFANAGGLENGTYTLMTSATLTGTLDAADLTGAVGAGSGTLQITGNNIELVVTGVQGGDVTPPTLTSITDDVSGGPVNIGATVTYTVTFDEDMDAASVNAADFANNGTAGVTVGTVTEGAPGVFSVSVTTTSPGTLVLRINALAVLEDVAGNDLDTDPALLDDTTITVRNAYQTWALTNAISSAPGADKDGDGVNNAIEFLLGGDVATNDLSKLPEVTMTATDMIFTFERKRSSIDGITGCTIEVGTTLTGWPTIYTVGSNTAGSTAGVVVTENSPAGFDTITLTVPIGSDPKKFARLKANVTE